MLRGMATVSFWAADHEAAKHWYTEFLGMEPYFDRPGYVEFRLGDYSHELGIIDSRYAPRGLTESPAGAILYWQVDDVEAVRERLLALGATELEPPTVRGEGWTTASLVDPFGNILGIMTNPHYLEVLGSSRQ